MSDLKNLLTRHGIDVAKFGTGAAKTLAQLQEEIDSGEARLVERDGRLVRLITVVGINVFCDVDGRRPRLVEDRQEFTDGRLPPPRALPTSIGEKMHGDEAIDAAVARGLREELGISKFRVLSEVRSGRKFKESPRYPGLSSEYVTHDVDVQIDASEYRAEYVETQADKTNYFVWQ